MKKFVCFAHSWATPVFVMKAATNGSSARRIAHSLLCAASSGSRPAQYTPAMMTAYIPKVDSCYVADLIHCYFSSLRHPLQRGKIGEVNVAA